MSNEIVIDRETVTFIRTVHAASLLLLQAGEDRSQQETALRMIVEAANDELVRRGIDDTSHNRLG